MFLLPTPEVVLNYRVGALHRHRVATLVLMGIYAHSCGRICGHLPHGN